MKNICRIALPILLILVSISTASAQWMQQPFPSTENLWKVKFVDENTGWVVGHSFVYHTTDGGDTWTQQDTSLGAAFALCALSADVAFYSNWTGAPPYSRGIRRTTDGGSTWTTVDPISDYITDLEFVDAMVGFAAGGINTGPGSYIPFVRRTTDGGSTWATVWTDSTRGYELEAISFANSLMGWGITYDGYIYHTDNGGLDWTIQDSIRSFYPPPWFLPLRDIRFVTTDSGWAVGGLSGNCIVAKTTDGGDTWVDSVFPGISSREIEMIDSRAGWVAGMNYAPYVFTTADGGLSWEPQSIVPSFWPGLESISMISESMGWAVGGGGHVYKTTNGGVTSVAQESGVPRGFSLSQNYPNPFNAATIIDYRLSIDNYLTLKVYDLLGQEVATLVDEVKQPGTYSVTWDASAFASGVYIYKMTAGGFVESKKLVLLR